MIRVIQEFPSLPIFNQPEVDLCIGIYFMSLKMAMPYQILARFVHLRLLYENLPDQPELWEKYTY